MRLPVVFVLAALAAGLGGGCGSVTGANDGAAGGNGGGGGAGGSGGTTCSPPCGSDSVCVGTVTNGGVAILSDGGVCPAGSHPSGSAGICQNDPTYSCQPKPAGCGATVTCACASSLCEAGHPCQSASNGMVMCVEDAP